MNKLSRRVFFLILLVAVPALAVVPQFWEVRSYEEFVQGDLDGVSVTGEGDLVLAPLFEELYDTGEPLIFSSAADPDGNVYLGTGHEGRVFRADATGNGRLVADFDELDVLALAAGADGTLFAATSPDGRVYRIVPGEDPEVYFDPDDLYIWDLQFDSQGRLLVATGEDGIIYRVGQDGSSEVFYDSDNTHILTMVVEDNGTVVAGGSPRGYIYRIGDDGRAFVLYDSGTREVRSIALAPDGRIYAAVLDSSDGEQGASTVVGNGGVSTSVPTITVNLAASQFRSQAQNPAPVVPPANGGSDGNGIGGASGRGPGTGTAESRILEILPDGAVTTIWKSDSEMVFAILFREDELFFSSGTRGRVYSLGASRRPTLLAESTEEQTTRLMLASDKLMAASSNRGKLWLLAGDERSQGSYRSAIRDTGAISKWGTLAWVGRGVQVSTRSGNTASPDSTWSDWNAPATTGAIMSPPARFIQWEAVLDTSGSDNPVLSAVTLPYLQQNYRPDVSSLDILQPGLALREQQGVNNPNPVVRSGISGRVVPLLPRPNSRTVIESGAQALRWTAADQNDDTLTYSIFYKAENEAGWKLLADGLRDTFYTIEPDTLPDGMYMLRLVASDIGSNPPESALEGEITTRPFAIDNTPPVVTITSADVEGSRVRIEAAASDLTSTLKQAETSVDAGPWVPVFPVDGILDTLAEEFRFFSGVLSSGEHVVSVRIYDQNENVGIGKTIVRLP